MIKTILLHIRLVLLEMIDLIWSPMIRTYLFIKINRIKAEKIYIGQSVHIQYPRNIILGKYILLGDRLKIYGKGNVLIGDFVYFSPNVTLLTSGHQVDDMSMLVSDISIGKLSWIAANVTILPGITIGEGCVIGAGSVVVKDIPAYSIAAGNPAKVIKKRTILYPYRLYGGENYLFENGVIGKL